MKQVMTIIGDFDVDRYTKLKKAYEKALKDKVDKFYFKEYPYNVDFIKHVLNYLSQYFKHIK